jgi:hypothetical protein
MFLSPSCCFAVKVPMLDWLFDCLLIEMFAECHKDFTTMILVPMIHAVFLIDHDWSWFLPILAYFYPILGKFWWSPWFKLPHGTQETVVPAPPAPLSGVLALRGAFLRACARCTAAKVAWSKRDFFFGKILENFSGRILFPGGFGGFWWTEGWCTTSHDAGVKIWKRLEDWTMELLGILVGRFFAERFWKNFGVLGTAPR